MNEVIEYAALVEAIAKGIGHVVELLESKGCVIGNCPHFDPTTREPLKDEASEGRDAYNTLARGAAGIHTKP